MPQMDPGDLPPAAAPLFSVPPADEEQLAALRQELAERRWTLLEGGCGSTHRMEPIHFEKVVGAALAGVTLPQALGGGGMVL